MSRMISTLVPALIALVFSSGVPAPCGAVDGASLVHVPRGTKIYFQVDEKLGSKKKLDRSGRAVEAEVWRDVVVDGRVVIPKGATVVGRIGRVKSAKPAGGSRQVRPERFPRPARRRLQRTSCSNPERFSTPSPTRVSTSSPVPGPPP